MTAPESTETDRRVAPKPNSVKSLLEGENVKKRFAEVLQDRAPQFITSLTTLVHSSKALSECQPMSVIAAALTAASLDLPIDRNLGFSAIVPYKGVAQFQMQWKGYVQLAHRSGQYEALHVTEVYGGMVKECDPFTGKIIKGKRNSDLVVGFYAYFKLLNGFEKECYMTVEEIHEHAKRYSKSYDDPKGKWTKDFDAMARKTVLKRLLTRWGIFSIEMQKALKEETPEEEPEPAATMTIEQRKADVVALYGEEEPYIPSAESIAETQAALDTKREAEKQPA